jgi:Ca-activated chloride channel family protein
MIKRLQGDRIGLIIFAGAAYVQFPLTTDYSAANLFLSTVNTESIPQPGTDIASAIDLATNSFKKSSEEMQIVIIIITDGEDHEGGVDRAIESAVNQDVVIYTIGMGSANGAPIPVYDNSGRRTGYKKDSEGEVVLTKLNEEMLKNIAAQGNGKYYYSTGDQDELNMIYSDLAGLDKTEFGSKRITEYEDRFYWFLIPAVLLLFIEFFITDRKLKWASALFRAIEKGNKKRL